MFLGCGVGAYAAAIFHLMTHAFFKALLFLGAGSVIHGLCGEQDMRKMGGLRRHMPITAWTFLIGRAGQRRDRSPGGLLVQGRDPLRRASTRALGDLGLWGPAAAFLTAFYMFRCYYLTFEGESRVAAEAAHHLHESPWS